jgi:hypothetical protein
MITSTSRGRNPLQEHASDKSDGSDLSDTPAVPGTRTEADAQGEGKPLAAEPGEKCGLASKSSH